MGVDGEVVVAEEAGGGGGEEGVLEDASGEDDVGELGALGGSEDELGEGVVEAPRDDGGRDGVGDVFEALVDEGPPIGVRFGEAVASTSDHTARAMAPSQASAVRPTGVITCTSAVSANPVASTRDQGRIRANRPNTRAPCCTQPTMRCTSSVAPNTL